MALKKQLELESGVTAEYIRIVYADYCAISRVCNIKVGVYKDAQARQAGKSPVSYSVFQYHQPSTIGLPDLYTHLKTMDTFGGAEDV